MKIANLVLTPSRSFAAHAAKLPGSEIAWVGTAKVFGRVVPLVFFAVLGLTVVTSAPAFASQPPSVALNMIMVTVPGWIGPSDVVGHLEALIPGGGGIKTDYLAESFRQAAPDERHQSFLWTGNIRETFERGDLVGAVTQLRDYILTQMLYAANRGGGTVSIEAHSWGGVLSYLALRELQWDSRFVKSLGSVRVNLDTFGSPVGYIAQDSYKAAPTSLMNAGLRKLLPLLDLERTVTLDSTKVSWRNYLIVDDPIASTVKSLGNNNFIFDRVVDKIQYSSTAGSTPQAILSVPIHGQYYLIPANVQTILRNRMSGTEGRSGPTAAPVVTAVSPNAVPGLDGYQVLTLTGRGFSPGAQVNLRTGGESYSVPVDRTTVVSATQIQIRANFTRTAAAWTAEVTNPDGRGSGSVPFSVVPSVVATSPPQDVRASQVVTDSFQKVLGRAPTGRERDLYVDLFTRGKTQAEIENALRTTGEYKFLEIVSRAFQKVLGRQATPRERDNFVAALKAGRTEADVEAALMATDEYRRRVAGGQPANQPPVTQSVTPQVTVSPSAGPRGTTFSQPGQGFTPNSTVTVHYRKPDGSEYPPVTQPTDSQGRYQRQWTAGPEVPAGAYQAWAVDDRTGRQSPVVSYAVTAQPVLPAPSGTRAPGGATPPLTTTGPPPAPAPPAVGADRVLLSEYPSLSQLDPRNYRDPALADRRDAIPGGGGTSAVKNLACAATVYVMLARGRGYTAAMVDDFYQVGPGAIRPAVVSGDVAFDSSQVVRALRARQPVVLHGYGGPLKEHFVLAVGIEISGGRLNITALDPYPLGGGIGPRPPINIDGATGRHPDLDVKFASMRLVSAGSIAATVPGTNPSPAPPSSPVPPSSVPSPVVASVSPNPVQGADGLQVLTVTGTGFVSGSQVTLRTGSEVYAIPPDRTTVVSATQIQVRVNVTRIGATWTAEVTNPGGRGSSRVAFNVMGPAVAPPPPPVAPPRPKPTPPPIVVPQPPPVPSPAVTGVGPNPVPGVDGMQVLTVTGSGFVPGSQVTLRTGREVYAIPPDRTAVVSATQIQVRVNVTKVAAAWTAEVTNPGGKVSGRAGFSVVRR